MSLKRTGFGAVDPVVEDTGDLAKLVDRVVAGHTPIVVARAGEPKAALVSLDDYSLLKEKIEATERKLAWDEWTNNARQLREDILVYRENKDIDLDSLIHETRDELEERDAYDRGS